MVNGRSPDSLIDSQGRWIRLLLNASRACNYLQSGQEMLKSSSLETRTTKFGETLCTANSLETLIRSSLNYETPKHFAEWTSSGPDFGG